jgi:hypothetical protein
VFPLSCWSSSIPRNLPAEGMCGPLSATSKRRSSPGGGLAAWSSAAPLFVGADGERITRGTLQNRVQRAFRRAGIDADRPRRPRPRVAPHLRHRARQRRRQRLHADETARPRVHGDLAALRHCGRHRDPHCRSPKQALRATRARTLTVAISTAASAVTVVGRWVTLVILSHNAVWQEQRLWGIRWIGCDSTCFDG